MARAKPQPRQDTLADWLSDLPQAFLYCREMGHRWQPWAAEWRAEERAYYRTLRCDRCRTERADWVSERGERLGGAYTYAEGYQHKGHGRMVGAERDTLRLESIQRLVRSPQRNTG